MGDCETKLKVIHIRQGANNKLVIVAIEQGHIVTGRLSAFRSERTGTKYRIDNLPLYLGDMQMLYNPIYSDIVCNYYRSREDFATNETMQNICKTKRGFDCAPVLCAEFVIFPCDGLLSEWTYDDKPEKFDLEVGDILTSSDFVL